jgi:integrase
VRDGQLTVRRSLDNESNEVIAPKHNNARTVLLSPRILAALAKLPKRGLWVIAADDGGIIDYDRTGGLLASIAALYALAGVPKPPKPIHRLRHTFGTVMARRVPLGGLQKLMGHADVATTMRYVDVSEDDKRDAIGAVGRRAGDRTAATGSAKAISVDEL